MPRGKAAMGAWDSTKQAASKFWSNITGAGADMRRGWRNPAGTASKADPGMFERGGAAVSRGYDKAGDWAMANPKTALGLTAGAGAVAGGGLVAGMSGDDEEDLKEMYYMAVQSGQFQGTFPEFVALVQSQG